MRWWMPVAGMILFMIFAAISCTVCILAADDGSSMMFYEILHAHRTLAIVISASATLASVAAMTVCIYITNSSIEVVGWRLKWNNDGYA